jgi:hypothetical protein
MNILSLYLVEAVRLAPRVSIWWGLVNKFLLPGGSWLSDEFLLHGGDWLSFFYLVETS